MKDIRIIFTAHNEKTADILDGYRNTTAPEIRKIEILHINPYVVAVYPRINFFYRKAINVMWQHEELKAEVIAEWQGRVYAEMRAKFGITENDLSLQVELC